MMNLLEQRIAGEKTELKKREENLKEELTGIHRKIRECEDGFQSEQNRNRGEDEK